MEVMRLPTVFSSNAAQYVVEHSRFIGKTFHLPDVKELDTHLTDMSDAFPGANHYTWAYRIDKAHQRASDNGEPHGTAGMPMLYVLDHQGWDETLVVVVRYFGGIKLGRGGLVHAYQHTAQLALEATIPGRVRPIRTMAVTLPYAAYDRVNYALKSLVITVQPTFRDIVYLIITLDDDRLPEVTHVLESENRGQWTLNSTELTSRLMPINEVQNESPEQ